MASASCGRACRGPTAGTPPVSLGGGRARWGGGPAGGPAAGVAGGGRAGWGEAPAGGFPPAPLLHAVGKIAPALAPSGRVVATLAGAAGGRDPAHAWWAKGGFTRRVGLYLRHD